MDRPTSTSGNEGFQSQQQAWDPTRSDILYLLDTARHRGLEPIYFGSNHCFLVTLESEEAGESLAVYKPGRGEYPLYDFPSGTLYLREFGSALVDRMLGWNLIPPTVITSGRYGAGSLQLFIEGHSSGEIEVIELQRLALLDLILNNADRKADHCLVGDGGKLWAIDHGLTFHVHPKLRTILWHFSGEPIPAECRQSLRRFLSCLKTQQGPEVERLRSVISRAEWQALVARTERLVDSGRFANPRHKPVPYRW